MSAGDGELSIALDFSLPLVHLRVSSTPCILQTHRNQEFTH